MTLTRNGWVLLHKGNLLLCLPQSQLNKDIKVKDNNQSPELLVLPSTKAGSNLQPTITTSSPACRNTFVTGCVSQITNYFS